MGEVITFYKASKSKNEGFWSVMVVYDDGHGGRKKVLFHVDELEEIDQIVESGPHFGRIEGIAVFPTRKYKEDWEDDETFMAKILDMANKFGGKVL